MYFEYTKKRNILNSRWKGHAEQQKGRQSIWDDGRSRADAEAEYVMESNRLCWRSQEIKAKIRCHGLPWMASLKLSDGARSRATKDRGTTSPASPEPALVLVQSGDKTQEA